MYTNMAEPPSASPVPQSISTPTSELSVQPSQRLDIRNVMNGTSPPPSKTGPRKAHRKSRHGCIVCKQRRVKCDEVKPRCGNCIKHNVHCDFAGPRPPTMSLPNDSPRSLPTPIDDAELCLRDIELFHHWSISTSYTMTSVPTQQEFMRTVLPTIGLQHTFVLRALLALSAFHKARFQPAQRQHYLDLASYHYTIGLRRATTVLPDINDDNCDAIHIFTMLTCAIGMAAGPQPNDYIFFGDNSNFSSVGPLSRGMETILRTYEERLSTGILAPILMSAQRVRSRIKTCPPHCKSLDLLREHISTEEDQDGMAHIYLREAENLQRFFYLRDTAPQSVYADSAFHWIIEASDLFKMCLQERRPYALAIFAHVCVLIHEMGPQWWLDGWPVHLISGVYEALSNDHRIWIDWPLKQIGWFPGG